MMHNITKTIPPKFLISVSIVVFDSAPAMVGELLEDLFEQEEGLRVIVIDNSPDDRYASLQRHYDAEWLRPGLNLGYGRGHNLAFSRCNAESNYHLIVNPDVRIPKGALHRLSQFMESRQDIGLIQPRVVYPDGATQYVCKLLPNPYDLFVRRFVPIKSIKRSAEYKLELRGVFGYDHIAEIPWLSGSFMFIRTSVGRSIGLFDERFFLYMEDVDLSRRIGAVAKNVYFPEVTVSHAFQKDSYRSLRGSIMHIRSAIIYFKKWGWIFDKERARVNRQALRALRTTGATIMGKEVRE